VQSKIDTGISRRPRLPDADFPAYGRKLTALAEWMAGEGVAMAYHHHMGTSSRLSARSTADGP
jgi:hypothetical protein